MGLIRPGMRTAPRVSPQQKKKTPDTNVLPVVMAGAKQVVDVGNIVQQQTANKLKTKGITGDTAKFKYTFKGPNEGNLQGNLIKVKEGNMFTPWKEKIEIDESVIGKEITAYDQNRYGLNESTWNKNTIGKVLKQDGDEQLLDALGYDKEGTWKDVVGDAGTVSEEPVSNFASQIKNLEEGDTTDTFADLTAEDWEYKGYEQLLEDSGSDDLLAATGDANVDPFTDPNNPNIMSDVPYGDASTVTFEGGDTVKDVVEVADDTLNVGNNMAADTLSNVAAGDTAGKFANLPNQGKFMGEGFFTEATGGADVAGGPLAQVIKAGKMAADAGTLGSGGMAANLGFGAGSASAGTATGATNALSGIMTNPAGLLAGMTPFGWAMMAVSVLSLLNEEFDWF